MSRAFKVLQQTVATEAELDRTLRVLQTAPPPAAQGTPLPGTVRARVERHYEWFSYREDVRPHDPRVKLLFVIRLELARVPELHAARVQAVMRRFRGRAWLQTACGDQYEALGFQDSMEATLLESELEAFLHE